MCKIKEIGGYLEFENLIHNEYYPDAIALNLARNALVYLVKAKKITKLYIPFYLCNSVPDVCDREHISYEFYHIDENFCPVFNKELDETEYLYIVNFYGQLSNKVIEEYKVTYKNIIVDNVQAFFAAPVKGVDTIYSCRKFFGVPDGAYLVSDIEYQDIETDVSCERFNHILGRYDNSNASDYYSDFLNNEHMFDDLPVMYMSKSTKSILGAINYKGIIDKRNDNWSILHSALCEKNQLDLRISEAPYMYPFYCENAEEIRKLMAKKFFYIPTLWPNVEESAGSILEKQYARKILPLPVDQRYGAVDMERMVEELTKLL